MKPLLTYCLLLSLLLVSNSISAQERDPNSTPPGAPMIEPGDITERMVPNHPGNAGQKVNTSTFAIIESQSINAGHDMDQEWRTLLLGMGHIPTILPQNTLDNLSNLSSYDVLIVSSGVMAISPARVAVVQQFLQSGRPVYFQGEYLTSYTSNQGFQSIVNATGGTFAYASTVSGSLVPTNALNLYATTPNAVTPLSYHWYGSTGAGCDNLEYFMRYGATNIGFVYCPTNSAWGDMIQSTDQDWIRQTTSPALMQNIVYALLSGNACSVVCGTIVLDSRQLDLQAIPRKDQGINLVWSADGDVDAGRFFIECNGVEIGSMEVEEGAGMVFQFADMRIPSGELRYRVRHLNRNGEETMAGETILEMGPAPVALRVATNASGFRLWLSQDAEIETLWLTDLNGRRQRVEVEGVHTVAGGQVPMEGMPQGVYFLQGITKAGEPFEAKAAWMR